MAWVAAGNHRPLSDWIFLWMLLCSSRDINDKFSSESSSRSCCWRVVVAACPYMSKERAASRRPICEIELVCENKAVTATNTPPTPHPAPHARTHAHTHVQMLELSVQDRPSTLHRPITPSARARCLSVAARPFTPGNDRPFKPCPVAPSAASPAARARNRRARRPPGFLLHPPGRGPAPAGQRRRHRHSLPCLLP